MTSTKPSSYHPALSDIVKELWNTKRPIQVAIVLVKLKDILDSAPAGTAEGTKIRKELWELHLLHVLIVSIHQDFSLSPNGWRIAARLAVLISQTSCGLELAGADRKQLHEEQLPKAVEHFFLLAKRVQQQIINMSHLQKPGYSLFSYLVTGPDRKYSVDDSMINSFFADEMDKKRIDLVDSFKDVLNSVTHLTSVHYFLCKEAMKSPWLLQLLMSDDPKTVIMVMSVMEKMLRFDGNALSKVQEEDVLNLMDELIYKLTVSNEISIASSATKCVLRFCENHKPLVEILFSRYKGLRPLLRRWEGQGFERDLRQLYTLLVSGSALRAQSQRQNEAASCIQAMWKGVTTRRRLLKANKAFAKFQRTYRLKKAEEDHRLLENRVQTELQRRLAANHRKLMLQLKEKHLHVLEILPAAQIEKHLMKEKSTAALKIQSLWRGHHERNQLAWRLQVAEQVRAVIKIQRAVRLWLDRRAQEQEKIPSHVKPSGLTEERRGQLQEMINKRRQEQPTARRTREEVEEIHKTAHQLLVQHYSRIRQFRKKQYGIENLLARLDADSDLFTELPELKNVMEKDVEKFSSRSLPIATKAKMQHNSMLQRLQQPWWRRQWHDEEELDEDEKERLQTELQFFV